MDIGERFRILRNYLRLTQEEMARDIGTTKKTISNIESQGGSLTRERIQLVADKYDIDVRYFYGQIDPNVFQHPHAVIRRIFRGNLSQ